MATLSAAKLNAQYEERAIPLNLIDEPAVPERQSMEPDDLGALALNIKSIGLIKPIVVKPKGDRFETVAGHRRLLAMRIVKYSPVPCRVIVKGHVDPLAILVAENAHQESVNPVEEARFYLRLLNEKCGNDVDALCLAVGRRREFVEDRLLLLNGYPEVTDALLHRKINLSVARELNKIKDPPRLLLLLDVAIVQGANARQVAQWRQETEQLGPVFGEGVDTTPPLDNSAATVQPFQMECLFCGGNEDPYMMELLYLHKPCKKILLQMLNRQVGQTQ